jgi:hypothetical protein
MLFLQEFEFNGLYSNLVNAAMKIVEDLRLEIPPIKIVQIGFD